MLRILKDSEFFERIKAKLDDIKITSISAYELLRGAEYMRRKTGSKKELDVIGSLLKGIDVEPFTLEDAETASEIWARLRASGVEVNDADVMISAVSVRRGEKLLTLDRDFERIKEVVGELNVEIL